MSKHGEEMEEVQMDNVPAEVKIVETRFHDPKCDGFCKADCRIKLIEMRNKAPDKSVRRYIDELLKKG